MKLCFVTPEYPPMQGGVGDYTGLLARAMSDLGTEVSVLTSTAAGPRPEGTGTGEDVASTVTGWSFRCWRAIVEHVSKAKPDVLHVQYQTAGYAMHPAINLLPLRLRVERNRPLVAVTFHDVKVPYLFPKAGALRRFPGHLLAACADAVVATNAEDYSYLCRNPLPPGVSGEKTARNDRPLFAIPIGSNIPKSPPLGYDRERWRRRLGVERGELVLVYFGFLNESKGVDVLLQAFSNVLAAGLRARLLMAGGSFGDSDPTNLTYGRRIISQVQSSGYCSKVVWTGFTSREEVSASLLASDICVLPFNEGASVRHGSLLAAIEHGMPIITTRHPEHGPVCSVFPSLEEKVKLVPPMDAVALTEAILELGRSRSERERLGRAAAKLSPAFTWSRIGAAHVEMYYRLLEGSRRLVTP